MPRIYGKDERGQVLVIVAGALLVIVALTGLVIDGGYAWGQQRMAQLHGGRRDKLEISPNLWAGVGLVRGGAGTALVGDPETVAARIREYQDIGIDTFIMSGYPHLEEAYRFAELVFPLLSLDKTSNVTPIRLNTGPFGETIGNEYRPQKQASQS